MAMLHGWLLIFISLTACTLIWSQSSPPASGSELVLWTSAAVTEWVTILANKYLSDKVDSRVTSIRILESTYPLLFKNLMERDLIDLHIYAINPMVPHDFTSDQAILPVALNSIAIAVNLPNITSLALSTDAILSIFNGTCPTWNHSLIQQDNPSLALPSDSIVLVKRDDPAASTNALLSFFQESSSYWDQRYGNSMPHLPNDIFASNISRLIEETVRHQYSLTYATVNAFSSTSLTVVHFKNQFGLVVSTDDTSVVKDFKDSNHIPALTKFASCHYPLAMAVIIQMPKITANMDTAMKRSRFLLWIIEKFLTKTENVADDFDLIPIIEAKRDMLMLDSVQVKDQSDQRVLQTVLNTRSCMIGQTRSETSAPVFYIDILNQVLPTSRSPYIDTTCLPCPSGTYNIDPFSGMCNECPKHASCPGGQYLYVPQGTWAYVYTANQSTLVWVITCEQDLRSCCPDDHCRVDPNPGSSTTCSELFTGPGCGRCIPGYIPWLRTCYSCDLSGLAVAAQILGFIIICVIFCLFAMLAPQMSEMIYIETFLFHLQISIRLLQKMSLWSKANRTWVREVLIYLAGFRIFDDSNLLMLPALSCPFQNNLTMVEILSLVLAIVYFTTPTVLITVIGPFWLNSRKKSSSLGEKSNSSADVGVFVDPDRDRAFLRTLCLNGTFRMFTFAMTPILYRSLSAMNCIENPIDGSKVLSSALSEKCWTEGHQHLYVLAGCIIFTFVVIFPFLLNREMTKPEHVLNAHDPAYNLMSHMKKRYRVYRPAIVAIDHVLEKFLILSALVFGSRDPYALTFSFGLLLLIRINFTFYARHYDNVLRILSILSLTTITMISLSDGFKDSYNATLMSMLLVMICPIICAGMCIGEYINRRKLQHKIVPVIKRHLAVYSSTKPSTIRPNNFSIITNSSAGRRYPHNG